MAAPTVTFADIAPADLALRALDIPMLIANAIPVAPTTAKWVESAQVGAGDIDSWTDRTDSASPASNAWDGKTHTVTKPTGVNDLTWYLCFDFSTVGIVFDLLMLTGHSLDDGVYDFVEAVLEVADNAAFSLNLREIGSFALRGNGERIADLVLDHAGSGGAGNGARYSDVRYARIKFTSGTNTDKPEVGELVLGRSRQLEQAILLPFDDLPLVDDFDPSESEGGVINDAVRWTGRYELLGRIVMSESAGLADLRAWKRQVKTAFVWLWEPNSNPQDYHHMMLRSVFRVPNEGRSHRFWGIEAVEQGPERLFLDNEIN